MMEVGRHGVINCGEARWRRALGRPVRGRGGSNGWGPLGSDVRGNAVVGLRKLKEEAPFSKYVKAAQAERAEWAERAHGSLQAKRPGCSGLDRMGQNQRRNDFRIKFEFLNIKRLWKFAQGDLGGILT
jgi:hypothetical protein